MGDETEADEADEAGEPATAATVIDAPAGKARRVARDQPGPMRLGHFHLLEPLGQGGMGTVYSAYDLRLDRKVAIKLLSKEPAADRDHSREQRLLREAQAMAKLSHPNVVPVYEVGVDHETVFIAMEYVAGQTLGKWLKETKRTWREIVEKFALAGRGLAAAHEAGIVHRDFKPANVLVDGRGGVRVSDFGIAQVRGAPEFDDPSQPVPKIDLGDAGELTAPTPSTPLTEQGSIVGTPAYMSPEQYRSAAVDARSDQFSFCVALYEALFRKRPFKGRGKALAEAVKQGSFEKPDATVPGWVSAIVVRGLAPDPEKRFESMTTLVDALSRDPNRLRKRIAVGVLGAGALAAVAMTVGWRLNAATGDAVCEGAEANFAGVWDDGERAALERSFTATSVPYAAASLKQVATVLDGHRSAWIAMRTDACRATRRGEQSEHVLDLRMACLDHRLGEIRALTTLLAGQVDAKIVEHAVAAATSLTPLAACADTTALLQPGAEPTDPAARARRTELLGRLDRLNATRRVNRFKELLAPARALVADARAADDARVLASALELQGALEMHTGDLKAAELTLAEAIRRARQLGDIDLFVTSSIDLVSTLAEGGISKSREALGVIRLVEAIVDDTHDPALPIRLMTEKADEYMVLAHPELALPILEKAIEQGRHVLGEDHSLLLQLRGLYGSALGNLGKHAEALAAYEAHIASSTRVLGALHPSTLIAQLQRCRVVVDSNSLEPGEACFAKVLPEAERVIGSHDRELLSYRSYHGSTLARLGKLDAARRVYAAAFADVPADAWSDKFFVAADIAGVLGSLEVEAGEYESAVEHCERAAATVETKHTSPSIATCLGEALLGLGNAPRALAVLEPVAAQVEGVDPAQLGADAAQIGKWRFAYARASWAVRHQAGPARALAEKARGELGEGPAKKQLDAWLAKLPAR